MKLCLQNISMVFSAGCMGGLVNSLTVWIFGTVGITGALGVRIAPSLTPIWLYPRIVWGGIWSVLFLLPLLHRSFLWRGLLYSLGPTAVQLFIVFPVKGKGIMGLSIGALTPMFVLIFNAVWGIAAAYWLKWSESSSV
jgi:hypothetical protein